MIGIFKAIKPLDLTILFFAQIFSSYFLGFGNSLASILDSTHLTVYLSTLFAGIMGNLFIEWSENSISYSGFPRRYILILAVLFLLTTLLISYSHSLKMGNIFVALSVLYFCNSLFLRKLPVLGSLTKALIAGGAIFVLLPFDANLKSKLILIYSLYFFGMQFIRESLNDIINLDNDRIKGYFTLPVVAGLKVSRVVSLFFLFVLILLLTTGVRLIMLHYFTPPLSFVYLAYNLLCIGIPMFHIMSRLQVIHEREEYLYLKDVSTYAMITIGFSMLFF